jgi:hypothetical protein
MHATADVPASCPKGNAFRRLELASVLACARERIMIGGDLSLARPGMRVPLRVRFAAVLLAASTLGLVACDDAPKTTTMRRVEDPWAFAQTAMASGPLLIVVRGVPSLASEAAVEDAVLQAAQEAVTWTASPRFTVIPARGAASNVYAVYIFNGRPAADPCGEDAPGGEWQQGGRVSLLAALCDGADMLVRVDGRLKRHAGLDDRRFAELIGQATRELLAPPPAPRP